VRSHSEVIGVGSEVEAEREQGGVTFEATRAKLQGKKAFIGVVGLGYVGLPLVAAFGKCGFRCLGVDADPHRVDALARGRSHLPDVPDEVLARLRAERRLTVSTNCRGLARADAILICVPTPVHRDKCPDLSQVLQAGGAVGRALKRGQLVVLESTCYPGTTEDILRPLLERQSGLAAGTDFWLAFSPERIDPGNERFPVTSIPKVVGGMCSRATELAAVLYSHIVPRVVRVSSPREAEMSKLIENTFRHVNIALANELAMVAERLGVDFWEALAAASSKPFGFMPFRPGPGVGGHCIPVDPHYLAWKARECQMSLRLIEAAEEINASMPRLVVERVTDAVNRRGLSMCYAQVLLLGMSYKRGIGDVRGSPALRIMELLRDKGARVSYHDPYVPQVRCGGELLHSLPLTEEALSAQDCVVLVTDHDYDLPLVLKASRLLIDTRNAVGDRPHPGNCLRLWARNGHPQAAQSSPAGVHHDHTSLIAAASGAPTAPSPRTAALTAPVPPTAEGGQR
jgi:UDP-N-acetyl-D-glucosamine dehydrogenase